MSVKLKPVSEQTIVLTGATSGNGLATVREAARRGAKLVLAARNEEALEEIAAELRAGGAQVAICVADVASEEDVERIAQTAIDTFGGFDTWVNDAAAAAYGQMDETPMADHRRIFDVNYFGLLKGSLVAAAHLRTKGGAIINLGSVLSDRAMIFQGAYSATKHAVKAATDALRMELERSDAPISVTLIKPGAIHTPYPEHARSFMEEPPRLPAVMYDPRLVADAILFAAENPRRHLYIGGNGYMISMLGWYAPRLSDTLMKLVGRNAQTDPDQPTDPAARDNLYEPRKDGSVDGHQDYYVRQSSLLLEAQKSPLKAAAALAVGPLAVLAWAANRRGSTTKRS
ncbi:SDR family oxidoreductase [Altericroceibacterium xinjiangense]|uniref:SDR family oxidoreductase n=1 Tax=Altericroceibacterium xinjiangense TaxID=762261 RepID=UPI000F7F33BF|nr:SDR family oxidoreductase [Altericroceibacterium xinjiangense]